MEKYTFVTRSSMPSYEEYCKAIRPLWDSRLLTNMGEYHQKLEQELKKYLNVPEVSLTVNGHMALELAIQSFNFPENAEVITTPFTFISTTHAIVRNHLCPVFCDVKETDGTIDETKIEELITEKTVAILPVHVYGHICNVEAIQEIAEKYNLKVIYDAAHAFGESYKGIGVANFGDASAFSFHATKVFNTIEGGAVTAGDHRIYEKLYDLKNFGIRGEELVVSVGANAKMNEFAAIMGLCNLKHITEAIDDRKRIYEFYLKEIQEVKGIRIFEIDKNIVRNYAYFPIVVSEKYIMERDELYKQLIQHGIYARKYFFPLTVDQVCFKNKYRNLPLPVARSLTKKILVLPIFEGMKEDIQKKILRVIRG